MTKPGSIERMDLLNTYIKDSVAKGGRIPVFEVVLKIAEMDDEAACIKKLISYLSAPKTKKNRHGVEEEDCGCNKKKGR